MRTRFLAVLAMLMLTTAAYATPVLTVNGGTSPVSLMPGGQAALDLVLTPAPGEPVAGYNLIFAISSPTSISIASCAAASGVSASCADPTGTNFSFGISFGTDQTGPLTVATVTIDISASAVAGSQIQLTSASTWTNPNFDDFFFNAQVIADVAQVVPEPRIASLLALGLTGLAALGRRRIA